MRTHEIFRSSAFRVALAFAVAMTGATSLIFGFVYLQITTSDEARIRLILVDEAEKGARYSDAELRNALDLRLTRDLRRLDYVALVDASGKIIIGNVEEMPAIPVDGKSHFIPATHPPGAKDRNDPAIFVARARADGSVLLLGRSLLEVYALRETVLDALATAFVPMLLLAAGIGALFARRTSRRLIRIHEAIGHIMLGELATRLPTGRRPDEIDAVSRDVNLMLDEIVRLLTRIKSVSDDIAHDLRTPLAVVRAKLERGLASADEGELRQTAYQALIELDRAMATITALLRIAEIESGARLREFKPIDLAAIAADVFEFYEPLARAKSIVMSLDAKAPAPTLGDGDLMREALLNLVDNAVKFTPPGGTIVISTTMVAERPVIRVCDSGPGVAASEREKIFERFHRSARELEPGSGLGLSIVAAIAKLHDLDLQVGDNHPGAAFTMTPRRGARAAA